MSTVTKTQSKRDPEALVRALGSGGLIAARVEGGANATVNHSDMAGWNGTIVIRRTRMNRSLEDQIRDV